MNFIASEATEEIQLSGCFDAFPDHAKAQRMGQIHDATQDRRALRTAFAFRQEASVYLLASRGRFCK